MQRWTRPYLFVSCKVKTCMNITEMSNCHLLLNNQSNLWQLHCKFMIRKLLALFCRWVISLSVLVCSIHSRFTCGLLSLLFSLNITRTYIWRNWLPHPICQWVLGALFEILYPVQFNCLFVRFKKNQGTCVSYFTERPLLHWVYKSL